MSPHSTSSKKKKPSRRLHAEELESRRVLATFTVTSLDDAGPGTLRRAVQQANALPGEDAVIFASSVTGGTINLQSQIDITEGIEIDASAIGGMTIDLSSADPTPGLADGQGIRAFSLRLYDSALAINGLTISGGDVAENGGAILVSSSTLTLLDSTLSNNAAMNGGAIEMSGCALRIVGSEIANNSARSGSGGGVNFHSSQCSPVVRGSDDGGKSIMSNGRGTVPDFELTDSVLSGNSAMTNGGGIAATINYGLIADSQFLGNVSGRRGGGFYIDGSFTSTNTLIQENAAEFCGGGDISINVVDSTLDSATIRNNESIQDGGGLCLSSIGGTTIRDSVVSGNIAGRNGGGIAAVPYENINRAQSLSSSSGIFHQIVNTSIYENTALSSGGGTFVSSEFLRVSNSAIRDNSAVNGAGFGVSAGQLFVNGSTLSGNHAASDGGGIFTFSSGVLNLSASTISGNSADANGGGLALRTDSILTDFEADFITVADNVANADSTGGGTGGGIFAERDGFSPFHVRNSIFAKNRRGTLSDSDVVVTNGDFDADYTLVENGSVSGSGNLSGVDPQLGPLADNGGPTMTHAILPGSPVIDAGDPMGSGGLLTDQRGDGFFRLQDGNSDGNARVDMGAFEIQGVNSPPVANAGPDTSTLQSIPILLDGTGSFDSDNGPLPLTYSWTLITGPAPPVFGTPDQSTTTFSAFFGGFYVVRLTVSDGESTATDAVFIAVGNNAPPVADASLSDVEVSLGIPAILDASGSFDPDGETLTYEWNLISSPPGSLPNINDSTAEITFVVTETPGIYTFDLTVCDAHSCDTTEPFDINFVGPDPFAFATAPDVSDSEMLIQTITVIYSDDVAVDATTIGPQDIEIILPDASVVVPVFQSKSSQTNAGMITATYDFAAPGGEWDLTENGLFEVRMRPNQVFDSSGTAILPGVIGSFNVAVNPLELFEDRGNSLGSGQSNDDVDLADLDGDGDLDAFVATRTTGNRVWFNDGTGTFVDSGQTLGDDASIYAALGDLDGDGDIDAVVATLDDVVVWRNNGSGVFTLGTRIVTTSALDIALGDLNGDGHLDAYIAQANDPDLVLFNDGFGNFFNSGQFLGNSNSKSVEFGDVDGDGDLDAAVGVGNGPNLIWKNDGNGFFSDSGQLLGDSATQHFALGDIDGDGDLDGVAGNSTSASAPNRVWLNDGAGIFSDSGQSLGSSSTSHVALNDLDLDGDLDIYEANWFSQPDRVWLNNGDGTFVDSGQAIGADVSSHVALGDIDGDGDTDAVVATFASSQLNRIWFNTTLPAFDPYDFDGDGDRDGDDIDSFCLAVPNEPFNALLDTNGNGIVESTDILGFLDLLGTKPGDANLDGAVDVSDFNIWNANKFTANDPAVPGVGWSTGDFNCDGFTNVDDFNIWNANRFTSVGGTPKPLDQTPPIKPRTDVTLSIKELIVPTDSSIRPPVEIGQEMVVGVPESLIRDTRPLARNRATHDERQLVDLVFEHDWESNA